MVVEIGCGHLGGFIPRLLEAGYDALGVDPEAPQGGSFRRIEFERSEIPPPVDAMVACTSLHHVSDPAEVLDKAARTLASGGLMIVVEWDWERFDEATARWCFERLDPPGRHGWLHHRRDEWTASGQPWDIYLRGWARAEGLHSGQTLLRELERRFHTLRCGRGPYFFADLVETSEADEATAIEAEKIRATRIEYVGKRV
jgi:SAM-dependent methyltransferase